MKLAFKKSNFPLHIHISTLLISILMVVCAIQAWFSYQYISRIMLTANEELFEQISDESLKSFQASYRPMARSVGLIASSELTQAKNLDERMQYTPMLIEVLRHETSVAALQIGYDTGEYFIVRPLRTPYFKDLFHAPAAAEFVIDNIAMNADGSNNMVRLFLNSQQAIIGTRNVGPQDYDPRKRPWYLAANTDRNALTKPYKFAFMKKMGLNLTRKSATGNSVVAADITLDTLSDSLTENNTSQSALRVMYNDEGMVLGHNDIDLFNQKLTQVGDRTLMISDLKQDILLQAINQIPSSNQMIEFMYQGQLWYGKIKPLVPYTDTVFKLLMLIPEEEILQEAYSIRTASMIITVLVVLCSVPIAFYSANLIARPLRSLSYKAQSVGQFNFKDSDNTRSHISEIQNLQDSMNTMKETLGRFLTLIDSMSEEQNFDRLLDTICKETAQSTKAEGAALYLVSDDDSELIPYYLWFKQSGSQNIDEMPVLDLSDQFSTNPFLGSLNTEQVVIVNINPEEQLDNPLLKTMVNTINDDKLTNCIVPLRSRSGEKVGVLNLIYKQKDATQFEETYQRFIETLSGFVAVTIESRQMLSTQKSLLESFIQLIANAIDTKSPYTGGHCQRVPTITKLLAEAACESTTPPFKDYQLTPKQWEELHTAAWLHDCGKITTPEFVVDKATKLETLYNRIHEIRTRFEVLKRDAQITALKKRLAGEPEAAVQAELEREHQALDEDFAFVAKTNIGSEFMSEQSLIRLEKIAQRTWQRTLDDTIGLSWAETERHPSSTPAKLPVTEKLLANKPEHKIAHDIAPIPKENPWGFKVETPQYKYDRGEIHNLSIQRGTLTAEERYKINDHIVQTIVMLDQLPFPKHLKNVPEIAGGHHEKMDGTGYPKRLTKEDMTISARIMAIADIFEALTASDRPYKKAKKLSEAIDIMHKMKLGNHIDGELFELFLTSGVYLYYAEQFLEPKQIDSVDIQQYLNQPEPLIH